MANNPVQIVLNSHDYIRRSDINPGGKNKDFYEGRNREFVNHRDHLVNQISAIENSLPNIVFDDVFYAQVELQSEAWAKSHRPVQKVFPVKSNVSFSGNSLGSMIVELTADDLPRIINSISSAEDIPKTALKDNKEVEKPTRVRSEVGAIKSIRLYSDEDKRKFSADTAIRWLSDARTGHSYYVEVFLTLNSVQNRVIDQ
jgi:nitrate reductase NapAB chaperone NapD